MRGLGCVEEGVTMVPIPNEMMISNSAYHPDRIVHSSTRNRTTILFEMDTDRVRRYESLCVAGIVFQKNENNPPIKKNHPLSER